MDISKNDFKQFLSKLYETGTAKSPKTEANMLDLFTYFNSDKTFREYTYQILKEFSEEEKDKYLNSHFVDFMNNLARQMRHKFVMDG
jgi:hypothetical protein